MGIPDSPPSRRRTLLVGPAGSGKTLELMRRIRPWFHEGREGRALLLLPTYGQVLHLRRLFLLAFPERRGILESPIVTFSSLAERVVDHPIRRVLSPAEKDLVLRRVLEDPVPGFGRVARYPGFRSVCLELLKEIKENGLETAEVAAVLRARAAGDRPHLEALAGVIVRYQAALDAKALLDHEDLLVALLASLREDPRLFQDLEALAVDGFTDFTRVEREILGALAVRADRAWVSITGRGPGDEERRFEATGKAIESFLDRGYALEVLTDRPRFRRSDLAALEANLFRPGAEPVEDEGGVEILVGADLEDETDRLARRVARLIRDEGYRPEEIGVVVRSFEGYRDLLPEAFARHGVPLLVHAGRPLASEPTARDALGVLETILGGWRGGDVRDLLLSGGLRAGDAGPDEVDAALRSLRRLPEGREAWLDAVADHEGVGESLRAVAAEEDALEASPSAAAMAERVRGWWGPLLRETPADTDPERATAEADARRAFSSVLDGVVRALGAVGDEAPGPASFAEAVRQAADRTDVRPRSRRFETVHAIAVTQARQWELRAVLVPGLLEGLFPRRPREDIFLRDDDRAELNREGRLLLKERLRTADEERTLFHVAATRARDLLVLSRPATDGNGTPLLASFFLRDVGRVFTAESLGAHESPPPRGDGVMGVEEVTGPADLRRRALLGLGEPWLPGQDSRTARDVARASLVHDRLEDDTYRRHLRIGLRFLETPDATLHDADLPEVARRRRAFSPSALTSFAQCPYQDFARSTLRLASPESDRLERLDLGRVAHETLRAVLGDGLDVDEAFDRGVAEILPHLERGIRSHRELADLRVRVRALAESERRRLASTGLEPIALEMRFGFGPDEVRFGGVRVRGVIDRVDAATDGPAIVIDYKLKVRGSGKRVLEEISDGRELQLPIYLAAVWQALSRDAAAAFLLPVEDGKPRGVVRTDVVEAGLIPAGSLVVAAEEDIDTALDDAAAVVAGLAARVHAGEIAIAPKDLGRCGRGGCPYFDLCRVEPWVLEAERAEEGES